MEDTKIKNKEFQISCPVPLQKYPQIVLGHGSGGQMTNELIDHLIAPAFGVDKKELNDAAVFERPSWADVNSKMAISTDSFVINPVLFPGGDIGSLAVHGTVNDIAMMGAIPTTLTAGFILEEGLEMHKLVYIVNSMAKAAKKAGVKILAGDTKVVQKGHGDEIFINTSGIGWIPKGVKIGPKEICIGDRLIVSGTLGDHGMAIMSVREGLEFETSIESDSCALNGLVKELIDAQIEIHCLRDLTRGGLAASANELSHDSKTGFVINEVDVPFNAEVFGACEILGMDILHIANEGKMLIIVPESAVESTLKVLHKHSYGKEAALIGKVIAADAGQVVGITTIGSERIIDLPPGELLPRIC